MSWSARAKTPTKPTGTLPKTTSSRTLTPGNRAQDENMKPFSSKIETNVRSSEYKGLASSVPNKRPRDDTSSSSETLASTGTPRTPLSTANGRSRTPLTGKKTPNSVCPRAATGAKSSGNVTPKRTANQRQTPTKNPSTKRERSETSRSVLVEFSDDIFVTPSRRFVSDQGTPTSVSVRTSSTISIHNTPVLPRRESPHTLLNRSLSASSLSHSRSEQSSDGGNALVRSQSEAKLSGVGLAGNGVTPQCDSGESSRLTVGVRVRPLHQRESGNTVFVLGTEIRVASDLGSVHRFSYDYCFPASGPELSSQEDVYETLVRPLVDTAFQGYNACLFAYGQTGSGKTYSMMGPMHANCGLTPESGIIPRFCREVLERSSALDQTASDQTKPNASSVTTTVEISYLEVYNEKIHDLLAPGTEQLKVREHPVYGPYVVDLSKHSTSTYNELQHWIDIGNQKRATAATEMNDRSSRSHSLFTVILTQTFAQVGSDGSWSHDQTRRSQINLVDLAGSERIAHSSVTTDRLREGVSINKSLLTLGKVMSALIEKRPHVPYRDSVLTWLLKESLGGNSRTTMLATISPSGAHIDETLSTLRYASQARSIINTVRVNEAPQDKLIRELRAEIARLRELESGHEGVPRSVGVSSQKMKDTKDLQVDVKRLQEQLEEKSKTLLEAERKVSACQSEKHDIEAKLSEYIENNKELAAKIASEKSDKQCMLSAREGEMKGLVDELVALREQHNSLKQHYLKSQDDLEFERGAKHQIMSEKEKDAGQIATLKASVSKLENELLIEKNEGALKNSEIKKLKSEINEIKLAQDSLTTTFLLKEEFCNAQAIAEVEKEELVSLKNKEICDLRNKLDSMASVVKRINDEMSSMKFLKSGKSLPNSSYDDVENVPLSLKKVKEHLEFLETTNQLLKQQLEQSTEEKNSKDSEIVKLRRNVEKSTENENNWKRKYEDVNSRTDILLRDNNVLMDDKTKLASSIKSLESDMEKLKDDLRHANECLDKSKENEKMWVKKYEQSNSSNKDRGKNNETLLEDRNKLLSRIKSLETESENAKKDLFAAKKDIEKSKENVGRWKRKHDEADLRNTDLLKNYEGLEIEKSNLERTIESLEVKVEVLTTDLDSSRKKLREARETESTWKAKYDHLNSLNEDLRKDNESLRQEKIVLSSSVKSADRELEQLKKDLHDAKQKLVQLENDNRKESVEVEGQNKLISDLEEKYKLSQDSLRICREERDSLDQLSKDLKCRVDLLESEKLFSSEKQSTELQSLRVEMEGLKDGMNKLNLAEKEIDTLKAKIAELQKDDEQLKEQSESLAVESESAKTTEVNQLRVEIQALQERNKYLKRKARKSKLFSGNSDDSRKLKTEIAQLKRVNLDVVSELEKVRGFNKLKESGDGDSRASHAELERLRAELDKADKMKSTIDALLQNAKKEMETAMSEMKVLKSENITLEKRANKAVIECETLRDQLAKVEKEKADMLDRINHISGEKSVTDYKLRQSLVNTKSIENKEIELKCLQEKNEALKEECGTLRKNLADLEHQLSLCKINEESVKSDLASKTKQVESLTNEVKAAQKMQRELMEEKLVLVKVMEKHFDEDGFEDRKGAMDENSSLKKELRMYQQRLDNKCEKVTSLNKRVSELEGLLVKVIDDRISGQLQLEDLKTALVNKDYSAYDVVMGLYLPHHLEYLVRKARVLTENYKIPYDIDILSEDRTILFKHLVLKAVAKLNRTLLDKWITKMEEQRSWAKVDDKELPWKVDMDSYLSSEELKMPCGNESPPEADTDYSTATTLGIKKKEDGTLDPVEWRRTLIQRHVRGMRDDYRVLIKYFGAEEDSSIYAILERIRAAVDRLEQVTTSIVLDSYAK